MKHIVALSGGKDSTAMALRLAETTDETYEYVCTPTGNELPEMIEHWNMLALLLRQRLKIIGSGHSMGSLIKQWNTLPNWRMRFCTRKLKIEPFQAYVAEAMPCTVYVGIRYDEQDREGIEYPSDQVITRMPLIDWTWDRVSVVNYLERKGVVVPDRTDCAACFFQTLYEWYKLWTDYPSEYAEAVGWEKITGHTLRSDSRDTWPAALVDLANEFKSGRIPKDRTGMKDRKSMCSVCAR